MKCGGLAASGLLRRITMRVAVSWCVLLLIVLAAPGVSGDEAAAGEVAHLEGEIAGEVTAESVLLHSRLTAAKIDEHGDVPGAAGVARFEIADNPRFDNSRATPWLKAEAESDFVVQTKVSGLTPATVYYYHLIFGRGDQPRAPGEHGKDNIRGENRYQVKTGPTRSFKTLAGDRPVASRFVVITCMHYYRYHHGLYGDGKGTYQGPDKALGYPGLKAILDLKPDFIIGTGDNVYYDTTPHPARTLAGMRHRWHEQFVQPRMVDLLSVTPSYWEKDDHDTRFDDCDGTGDRHPTLAEGIRIFREQLPVTDPADPAAKTYRTHRVTHDVQIWLTEGRDYRSPNAMQDGPDKTLWGVEQREWLKRSLLASDATFKMLVSPTGLVGPDDIGKRDSHIDIGGFRHEGTEFLKWVRDQGLVDRGFLTTCGDRHWQYHSIHPLGIEEFSTGTLVAANARMGVNPGDKRGTDPKATIRQTFTSPKPMGGFLLVTVTPAAEGHPATARFDYYDEFGKVLYQVTRGAKGGGR